MAIDKSVNPYYDDFDEFKNFHQILFKPGTAVQARELTQIQSILKNQIAKFGNHIFKNGSIVIPGNSFADTNVSYVKIESTYSGVNLNLNNFHDMTLVGVTSGVKAKIKHIVDAVGSDAITLYVSHVSGGTSGIHFIAGEDIYLDEVPTTRAKITSDTFYRGTGSIAYVNKGVYYVNGTFVSVEPQFVIISKYTNVPSCKVLFKIKEEVIDVNLDNTLLDPAQGTNNFSAPGADRLKISLELTVLPLSATITDDYIELMRYRQGVLEEHNRTPKYNELDKALAQRTYDESGNYVVSGLDVTVREHNKINNNGGVYYNGDKDKIVYDIESGKAYVKGFGVEKLSRTYLEAPKPRDVSHVKQDYASMKTSYGQYILVTGIVGFIDIANRETIQLWDKSTPTGGTQIGTAKAFAIDYYTGDGGSSPIYKLYLTNISVTNNAYEDIGGIRTAGGVTGKVVNEYSLLLASGTFSYNEVVTVTNSTRAATVAHYSSTDGLLYMHRHDNTKAMPITGDALTGGTSSAKANVQKKQTLFSAGGAAHIFNLPMNSVKTLKNASNAYDLDYTSFYITTIAAGASTTATLSPGTYVPIEAGTFVAFNSSGIVSRSSFSLNGAGTAIIYSGTAPVGGITIYTQVNYSASTPRTKTPQTNSTFTAAAATTVTLAHADVYEVSSITTDTGLNVTSLYTLETGQTDTSYELSSIVLKKGIPTPTGTLSVTYKYFSHGAGDYFTIDSYSALTPGNDGYLDLIPSYTSKATNTTYDLSKSIDFRRTVTSANNPIVVDSILETSVQRFLPRVDSICMDSDGKLLVLSGIPSDSPRAPIVPPSLFELSRIGLSAYMKRVTDHVSARIATDRYTMKDISNLSNRISRLEEYTTLTSIESDLVNTPVLDAVTGLDRYKTGLLVEDFTNPFNVGKLLNSNNNSTVSPYGLQASNETSEVDLELVDATDYFNNNGFITLPYYEKQFISVGVSSRTNNINAFQVVSWKGSMKLTPPGVNWVEVFDAPEVFNDVIENKNVYTRVSVAYDGPPCPTETTKVVPSGSGSDPGTDDDTGDTGVTPVVNGGTGNNISNAVVGAVINVTGIPSWWTAAYGSVLENSYGETSSTANLSSLPQSSNINYQFVISKGVPGSTVTYVEYAVISGQPSLNTQNITLDSLGRGIINNIIKNTTTITSSTHTFKFNASSQVVVWNVNHVAESISPTPAPSPAPSPSPSVAPTPAPTYNEQIRGIYFAFGWPLPYGFSPIVSVSTSPSGASSRWPIRRNTTIAGNTSFTMSITGAAPNDTYTVYRHGSNGFINQSTFTCDSNGNSSIVENVFLDSDFCSYSFRFTASGNNRTFTVMYFDIGEPAPASTPIPSTTTESPSTTPVEPTLPKLLVVYSVSNPVLNSDGSYNVDFTYMSKSGKIYEPITRKVTNVDPNNILDWVDPVTGLSFNNTKMRDGNGNFITDSTGALVFRWIS